MKVEYTKGSALVHVDCAFNLDATFGSGQAFRWKPAGPDAWEGMAGSLRSTVARTAGGISITPCNEEQYEGFWRHYLDLDGDYPAWERALVRDAVLAPMAACCGGMRLLNQPVWECLISFLISSNNNVKRISGIVERLCRCFGEDMGGYHAFPTADRLASAGVKGIRDCGAGYRAPYIAGAAEAVVSGFDPEALPSAGYDAAKAKLIELSGIGEKVADCVLLYSCGYREAFPVDVWVLRAMGIHFPGSGKTPREIRRFAADRFGGLAGLAQQYLFHYERVIQRLPLSPAATSPSLRGTS
jgi:N-glycosylase/DNA lyase